MATKRRSAIVMAGKTEDHASLFRRIRFSVHDSVALIELDEGAERILILRDIEMERAKQQARVTQVHRPADFSPAEGLSGDRATATAQAVVECLRRSGVEVVTGDRLLPQILRGCFIHGQPRQSVCNDLLLSITRCPFSREESHLVLVEQLLE